IIEVAALLKGCFIKKEVISCRRGDHDSKTNRICTIFIDQFKQIRRITKALAHFSTLLITYHSSEIYIPERYLLFILQSSHHHPCYPKENDIRSGHQDRSRIIIFGIRIGWVSDAIKYFHWP